LITLTSEKAKVYEDVVRSWEQLDGQEKIIKRRLSSFTKKVRESEIHETQFRAFCQL
jgi:hypothetical protein